MGKAPLHVISIIGDASVTAFLFWEQILIQGAPIASAVWGLVRDTGLCTIPTNLACLCASVMSISSAIHNFHRFSLPYSHLPSWISQLVLTRSQVVYMSIIGPQHRLYNGLMIDKLF